jgi:hypothetical protein
VACRPDLVYRKGQLCFPGGLRESHAVEGDVCVVELGVLFQSIGIVGMRLEGDDRLVHQVSYQTRVEAGVGADVVENVVRTDVREEVFENRLFVESAKVSPLVHRRDQEFRTCPPDLDGVRPASQSVFDPLLEPIQRVRCGIQPQEIQELSHIRLIYDHTNGAVR